MKSEFASSALLRSIAACGALLVITALTFAQDAAPAAEEPDATPEQIASLEKTLNGATLVGHFTVTGRNDGNPREERYELGEVKHLAGNKWLISARIKYGEHDLAIPLALPIRWAGDTPVITVDEMAFPGMGSYTARVMIYRDHYAGFWTGKDHGGHLYGTLERAKDEEKKDDAETAK